MVGYSVQYVGSVEQGRQPAVAASSRGLSGRGHGPPLTRHARVTEGDRHWGEAPFPVNSP